MAGGPRLGWGLRNKLAVLTASCQRDGLRLGRKGAVYFLLELRAASVVGRAAPWWASFLPLHLLRSFKVIEVSLNEIFEFPCAGTTALARSTVIIV
jgi:hypothetical protein